MLPMTPWVVTTKYVSGHWQINTPGLRATAVGQRRAGCAACQCPSLGGLVAVSEADPGCVRGAKMRAHVQRLQSTCLALPRAGYSLSWHLLQEFGTPLSLATSRCVWETRTYGARLWLLLHTQWHHANQKDASLPQPFSGVHCLVRRTRAGFLPPLTM